VSLLAAVTNLIRALAAYWELRLKRYDHDIIEQSRSRIETLEDELTTLRNSGNAVDTINADRVRDRIITEKRFFKHLPNSGTAVRSRRNRADG